MLATLVTPFFGIILIPRAQWYEFHTSIYHTSFWYDTYTLAYWYGVHTTSWYGAYTLANWYEVNTTIKGIYELCKIQK